MAILKELQYRQFDDLLDSVRIDFRGVDMEGYIEPQELIKVAIKINKELGLRINTSKEYLIDINKGKGKLPLDFDKLNFALVCESKTTVQVPILTTQMIEALGEYASQHFLTANINQYSGTQDIDLGINSITHNLHTNDVIVQVKNSSGTVLLFDIIVVSTDEITINNLTNVVVADAVITIVGRQQTISTGGSCTLLSEDSNPILRYIKNNTTYHYNRLRKISMEKGKDILNDCFNLRCNSEYKGHLKSNFFHTNFDEGEIYINYISVMEDDDGNLIVLDNPIINEYYEYALKERILENMYASGEPNVQQRLQYFGQKTKLARNNAMSYVNTPDFAELKQMFETNRKAQYHNYYKMFTSY